MEEQDRDGATSLMWAAKANQSPQVITGSDALKRLEEASQ
jgi:hypothetical protein